MAEALYSDVIARASEVQRGDLEGLKDRLLALLSEVRMACRVRQYELFN